MKNFLKIEIGDEIRRICVFRSDRKSMSLRVREDGEIEVRCNLYASEASILSFIQSKESWIVRSVEKQIKRSSMFLTGSNGRSAMWLGKKYPVKIRKDGRNDLSFEGDTMVFHTVDDSEEMMDHIFYLAAGKQLARMVTESRQRLDRDVCLANMFPLPRITLKYMKTRWGSCSPSKAHISISLRLIHFPPECLEYVLVHEYSHFLVMNHSKLFYEQVEKLLPDYRNAVRILKGA